MPIKSNIVFVDVFTKRKSVHNMKVYIVYIHEIRTRVKYCVS